MLTLHNSSDDEPELPGLRRRPGGRGHRGATKFDLSFTLRESFDADGNPAGIGGDVEYATDLYDPETITLLVDRLRAAPPGGRRRPVAIDRRARPAHGRRAPARAADLERHRPRRVAGRACRSCSRRRPQRTPDATALVFGGVEADLRGA